MILDFKQNDVNGNQLKQQKHDGKNNYAACWHSDEAIVSLVLYEYHICPLCDAN